MSAPGIVIIALVCVGFAAAASGQGAPAAPQSFVLRPGEAAIRTTGQAATLSGEDVWTFKTEGEAAWYVDFAAGGKYRFTVRAAGTVVDAVWPRMVVYIDGVRVVGVGAADSDKLAEYVYESEIAAGTHRLAVAFLNDAVEIDEDDPQVVVADRDLHLAWMRIDAPAAAPAPITGTQADWVAQGLAREAKTLEAAERRIDEVRKSNAVVRVSDAAGQPVPDVHVSARLVHHEFLFGCNIFRFNALGDDERNEAYKHRFAELFNYATIPFYWRGYRPGEGPSFERTDPMVAWCSDHGIAMKGHPLLWGRPARRGQDEVIPPDQPAMKQRVTDVMTRYMDRIRYWEVVNEPVHQPTIRIDPAYRWAREIDPAGHLIINEYYIMADSYPSFFELLTQAVADGVPLDGIGIQAHEPRTMRFPLEQVKESLDLYATFGKNLHITEYSPPSAGQDITHSYVLGQWDEQAQRDYAVKFYTVCFAHPAVVAITWWDFCDGRTFIPGGGMLREDLSPKPVYDALKQLIHRKWTTRESGTTDADGQFAFRGFRGLYELTVTAGDRRCTVPVKLSARPGDDAPAMLDVTLP